MRCLYRVRPYEKVPGSANALHEKWKKRVIDFVGNTKILSHRKYRKMCRQIIRDFDNLPMTDEKKPRVVWLERSLSSSFRLPTTIL